MAAAIVKYQEKALKPVKEDRVAVERTSEERMQEQRMHDVMLLLENLLLREEATLKLILDCLYDVGSANLIDKKFRSRSLNRIMKLIARLSKPVFKIYGLYWVKKNAPYRVTNWLRSKVSF